MPAPVHLCTQHPPSQVGHAPRSTLHAPRSRSHASTLVACQPIGQRCALPCLRRPRMPAPRAPSGVPLARRWARCAKPTAVPPLFTSLGRPAAARPAPRGGRAALGVVARVCCSDGLPFATQPPPAVFPARASRGGGAWSSAAPADPPRMMLSREEPRPSHEISASGVRTLRAFQGRGQRAPRLPAARSHQPPAGQPLHHPPRCGFYSLHRAVDSSDVSLSSCTARRAQSTPADRPTRSLLSLTAGMPPRRLHPRAGNNWRGAGDALPAHSSLCAAHLAQPQVRAHAW